MTKPALFEQWGHDALADDLATHLRGISDRMVWTDMQMGPAGSPRPDVYVLNKSFKTPAPIAYEVKVSVADFRSDVTKGKWQSYLKFAGGVTFAVPAGLIGKADVPPQCGLMVRGPDCWRGVKAPTISPVELPRDAWLKLLIDGVDRQRREFAPRSARAWLLEEKLRAKLGERVARAVANGGQFLLDEAAELERYNEGVKRVDQDLERYRSSTVDRLRREAAEVNAYGRQLLDLLGLAESAPRHQVFDAAHKLLRRLDENAELTRMRNLLLRAKGIFDDASDIPALAPPGRDSSLTV